MRARRVRGLDPDGSLTGNARRIVLVRLDELYSFADAARKPKRVEALHDMRIAAKRLRYVLEITEPCFGEPARRGAKQAKALQTLLGEIHDCDELLPLVRDHVKRMRAEDAAALRAAAGADAKDLDPRLASLAPNRKHHRGLETLHAYLRARRDVLYARFLREWSRIEDSGFRDDLVSELEVVDREPEAVDRDGELGAR